MFRMNSKEILTKTNLSNIESQSIGKEDKSEYVDQDEFNKLILKSSIFGDSAEKGIAIPNELNSC